MLPPDAAACSRGNRTVALGRHILNDDGRENLQTPDGTAEHRECGEAIAPPGCYE
ncbi:MAG: hypothetical protein JWN86_2831 [Planctomycetota bacterium]|nr:hypothetical protein [Planctomycetota bacterium]